MQYSGNFDEDMTRLAQSHGLNRNPGESSKDLYQRLHIHHTASAAGIDLFVGQTLRARSTGKTVTILRRTTDGDLSLSDGKLISHQAIDREYMSAV